ncbi:TPA: UDP glucuronosyltransferase 5, polypeptide G1, variant 3 [Trebouxia sp. C0006]
MPAHRTVALLCIYVLHCVCAQPNQQQVATAPLKVVAIPMSSSSHWFQALPLIRELSVRGHSCQVIFSLEGAARCGPALENLTNIEILTYNTSNVEEMDLRQTVRLNLRSVGIDSIRSTFGIPPHSHPLLQDAELHRKIQAFEPDLALTDIALVGGAALADKLGIPKAVLSVPGLLPPVSGHSYGSGASLRSTVPQWMTLLPKHMSFIQRIQNMVGAMLDLFIWQHVLEAEMDKVIWRQYNISPFSYLKSNRQAALVLFPTDWAVTNAEPLAPHMVAVGAITAAPAKALPSELEEFMQSAGDHGVVYASLGTTAIPEVAELKAIAQGLSAVAPAKALWKLSDSDRVALGNSSISVGSNVKIVKWVNQNDVLGHPSVKAFFTQGGTNSFNEVSKNSGWADASVSCLFPCSCCCKHAGCPIKGCSLVMMLRWLAAAWSRMQFGRP